MENKELKTLDENVQTFGLIPGIKAKVTAPQTYTVSYANGQQSYTEKFVVIDISSQYVGSIGASIDVLIKTAAAAVATQLPALGPVVDAGLSWLKNCVFKPDNSLSLYFAYHYCGGTEYGLDPTFVPFGLDPQYWNSLVNNLMRGASFVGNSRDISENTEDEPLHLSFHMAQDYNMPGEFTTEGWAGVYLKSIDNNTNSEVEVNVREYYQKSVSLAPGESDKACDIPLPWVDNMGNEGKCIVLTIPALSKKYLLWDNHGGRASYSTDGKWHEQGKAVPGDVNGHGDYKMTINTDGSLMIRRYR